MGRPKLQENEKVLYQRIGVKYSTYKKLKDKIEEELKDGRKMTLSDVIDELLEKK